METLELPNQVINSDWKDDIDYQPYEDEKAYISPKKVKKTTIARIKKSPIKLTIRSMINWDKVQKQLAA